MLEKNNSENKLGLGKLRIESYDVILIFVTAFAAPLVSHVCDLIVGADNNPLSSDKLLCAYFALIATYVICEFLLGYYRESLLWEKGWKLGNSDALMISTFIVVTTVSIGYYNTLGGSLFLVAVFAVFIAILILRPNRVELNSRSMVLFVLMVAVIIPAILICSFDSDFFNNPGRLAWLWLGQFFACLVFDGVYVLAKRSANRGSKRRADKE